MNCPHCQAANPSGDAVCFECGRPLAAITKGSVIADRYEVQGVLGRGGMGVVYRAHDRLLEEDVAIKVLKRELLAEPEAARRFRNEIKLARRVSHPNVCRIHEYGEHGGVSYISMAFVPGHDVRQRLADFPTGLPVEEAFDVAIQAARGLQAIHDVGVVHRDFKTPNIMREPSGAIRLMDFGIAKATAEGGGRLTATGMVVGTPEFMSPEQCRGQAVDARSDIYALGVVIFELFTGHVPFQGDSLMATLLKHLDDAPPLEGPGSEGLPPSVVPVLRKALAKSPEERYGRARDVAVALEAARGEAAGAPCPPAVAAAPAATVALPAAVRPDRERRRAARLELPLDISIKKLGPEGAVLAQERTLADNLSRTGLRVVTALDSVQPGDTVLVQEIGGDFQARAHVRHRFKASDGVWRLGLEFIDAEAPDRLVRTGDWTSSVSARPRAAASTPTPAPVAPASAPPLPAGRERRSSSRIAIPLELTLERLSPGGQVLQQERTLAENVGWGGAQVLTAMSSLNVGDVVRLTEQSGDFQTRAAVRNAHVAPDRIRRLNLEFLDRQAPDRLVPASMTPAGGTRHVPPTGATPRPAPRAPTSAFTPRAAPAAPPSAVTSTPAGASRAPATTAPEPAAAPAGPDRREVLELFAVLKARTHFEVLGLERSASASQVREAYWTLVRRFHPDAARAAGVADLQAELGAIMARLAEAQRVLTDVKRRSDYEAYLGPVRRPANAPAEPVPPAPEPPRAEPAYPASIEPKVREALELLKQEKNWDAIQLLEGALPQAQSPAQRHLVQLHLARAVMKNPKWLKRGEELLLEITQENPRHVEALLLLAGIYRGQKLRARAERILRKVLEVEPENSAAAAALNELAGGSAG